MKQPEKARRSPATFCKYHNKTTRRISESLRCKGKYWIKQRENKRRPRGTFREESNRKRRRKLRSSERQEQAFNKVADQATYGNYKYGQQEASEWQVIITLFKGKNISEAKLHDELRDPRAGGAILDVQLPLLHHDGVIDLFKSFVSLLCIRNWDLPFTFSLVPRKFQAFILMKFCKRRTHSI